MPQDVTFEWLASAATHAEARRVEASPAEAAAFRADFLRRLRAYGCGPGKIRARGTWITDFTHTEFNEMSIFGRITPLGERAAFFTQWADEMAERLLDPRSVGSHEDRELIHVSCTGYVSPSAVQKWASRHRSEAEGQTRVSHAYHMGCYASIPAIRQAMGSLAASPALPVVDLLHTELCSLHFQPQDHSPERMVVQSLFADGAIRYELRPRAEGRAFRVQGIREGQIPSSADAMTWNLSESGFVMTLSREVPALIRRSIPGFVEKLLRGLAPGHEGRTWFAIHPGGPRIIEQASDALGLESWQTEFSREILSERGNLSSATLPHLWEKMLASPEVKAGDRVVSLAFGPGLTVFGMVMERVGH